MEVPVWNKEKRKEENANGNLPIYNVSGSLLATDALSGCEIVKCQYYKDGKCNDPNEYVNKQGEMVCGRREDAILYEDYHEVINDNQQMMSFDRQGEI